MTAKELRMMLKRNRMSQRGAAKLLECNERTMRRYALGEVPIPRVVEFALLWVTLQQKFDLDPPQQ